MRCVCLMTVVVKYYRSVKVLLVSVGIIECRYRILYSIGCTLAFVYNEK